MIVDTFLRRRRLARCSSPPCGKERAYSTTTLISSFSIHSLTNKTAERTGPLRQWLGDDPIERVVVTNDIPSNDFELIRHAFPEATVSRRPSIRESKEADFSFAIH